MTVVRTVLIVDDDPEFRALAGTVVAGWGHLVVGEVGSWDEAIVAAQNIRPDVALVDVGLPDGDGIALAERLGRLDRAPEVVLISSDSGAASTATARRVGALAFVAKQELTSAELRRLVEGAAP